MAAFALPGWGFVALGVEVYAEGFFNELDARGESEEALDGCVDDGEFADGLACEVAHRLSMRGFGYSLRALR